MQHLRDEVPPLPDSVPAGLAALCLRCLAKEPEERLGSAAALARHLREPGWPASLPEAGTATSPATSATAVATGTAAGAGAAAAGAEGDGSQTSLLTSPGGAPPSHTDHRRRRPGWLVPLLAAVAVLVLLAGIGLALTSGDDSEPTVGPGPGAAGNNAAPKAKDEAPAEPEGIQVNPADYRGRPYADAAADLRGQGFEVQRAERFGVKGVPGTVDYVKPHGTLEPGTTITLGVWTEPARESTDSDEPGGSTTAPGDDQGESPSPDSGSSEPPSESNGNGNGNANGHDKQDDGGLVDIPGSG
jgi:hypothetical protein